MSRGSARPNHSKVSGQTNKEGLTVRILAAIVNYGKHNDRFLHEVLAEFQKMQYDVDVVVTSNIPKDLGPGVEVVVGLPNKIRVRLLLPTNRSLPTALSRMICSSTPRTTPPSPKRISMHFCAPHLFFRKTTLPDSCGRRGPREAKFTSQTYIIIITGTSRLFVGGGNTPLLFLLTSMLGATS